MEIIITSEVADNSRIFLEMTAGRTSGVVGYSAVTGAINVLTLNASHRAWGGGGRYFRTFAEATAAYKSEAMRAFISHLHDRVLAAFPERFATN